MSCRNPSLALAVAGLVALGVADAQGRPPPTPPAPADARPPATQVVAGVLKQFLVDPDGRVDGLLLSDGTQVDVTPRLGDDLTRALKPAQRVEVTGERSSSAAALRAVQVKSSDSGRVVRDAGPVAGQAPPVPAPAGTLAPMTARGRISTVLVGPQGEARGVVLEDGAVVRFPPPEGAAMAGTLKVGGALYARGYGTRNAYGSALEATAIGASESSTHEVFHPPAPGSDRPVPAGMGPLDAAGPRVPPPPDAPLPPPDGAPPVSPGASTP